MNKIRGLESLARLREQLPEGPKSKKRDKRQSGRQSRPKQQEPQEPDASAEAYVAAFDALLTLWAAVGTAKAKMPKAVADAHSVASLRLRPVFAETPFKEAATG